MYLKHLMNMTVGFSSRSRFILNIFAICLVFNEVGMYKEKYICAVKNLYCYETNVYQRCMKYDKQHTREYVHLE
jgi:hypothetical protein